MPLPSSTVIAAVKVSMFVKKWNNGKDTGGKDTCGKVVFSHCIWPGHTAEKCYKLHGYPPGHPRYKQQHKGHNAMNIPMAHASSSNHVGETSFNIQFRTGQASHCYFELST